jgi:anthranilate/para-aminobenzoate synthase component II
MQPGLRTLLLDNYDSYTFNLFQLLAHVNGGKGKGRGVRVGVACMPIAGARNGGNP